MKNALKRSLLLLALAFPAVGCIDDFTVPLDPAPELKLDAHLIGVWACIASGPDSDFHPKGKGKGAPFSVLEFGMSGQWYRIRSVGLDQADREEFWDAYPSTLGTRTLLNTWPASDTPRKRGGKVVFFAHSWISTDRFQFELVTAEALKGMPLSPAPALRKTLLSRATDPRVFKPWIVCTKAKAVNS